MEKEKLRKHKEEWGSWAAAGDLALRPLPLLLLDRQLRLRPLPVLLLPEQLRTHVGDLGLELWGEPADGQAGRKGPQGQSLSQR